MNFNQSRQELVKAAQTSVGHPLLLGLRQYLESQELALLGKLGAERDPVEMYRLQGQVAQVRGMLRDLAPRVEAQDN